MRRRPLCLAAILLVLLLWILPKDVWLKEPDIPSGEMLMLTGKVIKREQREDKQVYYLKNCLCSRTDSKFSVLAYTPKGDSYPIGCELSIYGTIYQLNKADNPGQFDGELYYQSQGILYTFQTEAVISSQGECILQETMECFRERLGQTLMKIYNERDGGILKAVLLGDKSSLREEDELLYQKNGISHLLAISGVKTLNLVLLRGVKKPINWAFLRIHKGKIYIKKWQFWQAKNPVCPFGEVKGG